MCFSLRCAIMIISLERLTDTFVVIIVVVVVVFNRLLKKLDGDWEFLFAQYREADYTGRRS